MMTTIWITLRLADYDRKDWAVLLISMITLLFWNLHVSLNHLAYCIYQVLNITLISELRVVWGRVSLELLSKWKHFMKQAGDNAFFLLIFGKMTEFACVHLRFRQCLWSLPKSPLSHVSPAHAMGTVVDAQGRTGRNILQPSLLLKKVVGSGVCSVITEPASNPHSASWTLSLPEIWEWLWACCYCWPLSVKDYVLFCFYYWAMCFT